MAISDLMRGFFVELVKSGKIKLPSDEQAPQQTFGTDLPQELLAAQNAPGAFDFLNVNAQAPDPRINEQLGGLEQTRLLGLDAALEAQAQPYEPSTFDNIAKYGGLAATAAGGVVSLFDDGYGRRGRRSGRRKVADALGAIGGLGLGYAAGAPRRFRTAQDRTFANETAQREAEFGAASAPLLREQQQFTAEEAVGQENFDRDFGLVPQAVSIANVGLRQREQDFRERPGAGAPTRTVAQQMFDQAQRWLLDGSVARWEDLPEPYLTAYTNQSGGGVQRGRDIGEITQEFESKQAGFKTGFQDLAQARYPDAYEEWLRSSKEPSLGDIGRNAQLGQGGFGPTTESNWFSPDKFGIDPELSQAADSMLFYRNTGNLPGYITQQRGLGGQQGGPPPNDGSYTDAEYAEFVKNWNAGLLNR